MRSEKKESRYREDANLRNEDQMGLTVSRAGDQKEGEKKKQWK